MFKTVNIFFTTAMICLSSNSFADDDDLFSDFSARAVFDSAKDTKSNSSGSSTSAPKRVTRAEDLRELLKAGGFEAKVSGSRVASSQKKLEPWTFPIVSELSEDEATISVVMGLASVKDVNKELTSERLLKMMKVSQDNAPMMFVYNAERKRVEVSITVQNLNVTGQMLRDEINRMAVTAKNNSDMWTNAEQKSARKPSKTTAPATQPTTTQSPTISTNRLLGKWAAARSEKEAFGVEFKTDGTFNLVYINNGQQSKSSGTFAVQPGSLKLSGSDGLKLEGKLTITSETEFRFEPASIAAMTFKKAN